MHKLFQSNFGYNLGRILGSACFFEYGYGWARWDYNCNCKLKKKTDLEVLLVGGELAAAPHGDEDGRLVLAVEPLGRFQGRLQAGRVGVEVFLEQFRLRRAVHSERRQPVPSQSLQWPHTTWLMEQPNKGERAIKCARACPQYGVFFFWRKWRQRNSPLRLTTRPLITATLFHALSLIRFSHQNTVNPSTEFLRVD